MLWIKTKVRGCVTTIGVLYGKVESRCTIEELKQYYDMIEMEVTKSEIDKEDLIIMGDLNAKIESGRKDRSGKLLEQLTKKKNLEIVNNTGKCEGRWTRINTNNPTERSSIDYIICNKTVYEKIEGMVIDEEKNNVLTKYHIEDGKTEITESDHMIISLTMKSKKQKVKETKKEKWDTKNEDGWKKYEKLTQNNTKLVECSDGSEDLDKVYARWMKEIKEILKKMLQKDKN